MEPTTSTKITKPATSALPTSLAPQPFLGETMYNSTFRNFQHEAKMIVDVPVEAYKESFGKFANPEGELSLKKVSKMLNDAIGKVRKGGLSNL